MDSQIKALEGKIAKQQKDLELFKYEFENIKFKVDIYEKILSSITEESSIIKIVFKNQTSWDKNCSIGFYGKDPIKQQSATSSTLAEVIIALKNYGLLSP